MGRTFPTIFVTHGAPTLLIDDCPTRDYLRQLGTSIGRPKAIVCVSAHWTTPKPMMTINPHPPTIHDFSGFPDELQAIRYPAPGDPAVAARVLSLLRDAGIPGEKDSSRGLDHGAWIPLMLMYPDAGVPVVQLSVQPHLGPEHHVAMGAALKALRDEGVLILASGSATHNLRDFFGRGLDDAPPPYVREFADWLKDAVVNGRVKELLGYLENAPQARRNHPTPEHFLPLFVAMGGGEEGKLIHEAYTYGILSMAAFSWR